MQSNGAGLIIDCQRTFCNLLKQYKLIVTQRRDGNTESSIADPYGEVALIWVEKYSVTGDYLIGITNGDYFWLDQRTGGRRIFDTKSEFLQFLNKLGVSDIPNLLSADSTCKTNHCQPCIKATPLP